MIKRQLQKRKKQELGILLLISQLSFGVGGIYFKTLFVLADAI
jgi:hypothetical protein